MNIVNDEFFLELEKDYEYGRSHIRVLWNLLLENFSFIEDDELGAYVLEQIVECRSSKKEKIHDKSYYKKVGLPLSCCEEYLLLESDIKKIVRAIYSPVYDKMEKNYLSDEREKDAYKFVYEKNHEKNYYV